MSAGSASISKPTIVLSNEFREYDPSLEWPGEEPEHDSPKSTTSTSFLRLIALESSCLPSKRRVAILTGFPEVQFGRDKPPPSSLIPRIRLKEMEVSKVHATIYWDGAKREWCTVDMGSKHGTSLRAHNSNDPSVIRLSQPRVASLPRSLHHLDCVSIGSTTFSVHIHRDNLACSDCASDTANEIPLFSTDDARPKTAPSSTLPPLNPNRDPKKSLAMLKQTLLRQHSTPSGSSSSAYVDRAARRREMHGMLIGAPGVKQTLSMEGTSDSRQSVHDQTSTTVLVSDPATPLPTSNVGHRLLSKMGWEPGTSLGLSDGDDSGGIIEPIQVNCHSKRAGLGTKRAVESTWESEKQRRL